MPSSVAHVPSEAYPTGLSVLKSVLIPDAAVRAAVAFAVAGQGDDELVAISGSGNLTAAGLTTNDEQFEVLRFPRESDEAAAQVDRFEQLTRNSLPLDQIEGSTIWDEWLDVRRQQAALGRKIDHLERRLNEREPIPERSGDKAKLVEDLQQLYDAAVAANFRERTASGTTRLASIAPATTVVTGRQT